jgi:hypothetical protein
MREHKKDGTERKIGKTYPAIFRRSQRVWLGAPFLFSTNST